MNEITIVPKTKTIVKHNPISGHSWTETITVKGYEVWGGKFPMTSHQTLKSAEEEKAFRIKFPVDMAN